MAQSFVLRTEIYQGGDWAEALRGAWGDLVESDPSATVFQTWEWQSTWYRHFGARKKPLVWTAWQGNDLVGLYPLVGVKSPWRALRPMGCGPSDYLQPVCQPALADEVSGALFEFLKDVSKSRLVDVHQLRETLPLAGLLRGERAFDQATCLVLDLPDSYDAYLKGLGKSLRYDVKRLEKPPFTDGQARIVPVSEATATAGVDFFLEAHKRRWSKRGLPGAFLGNRIRDFHRDWAVQAARKGWLWMSQLVLEGNPIGAIYAMRFGKACYFYQSGFDPAHSALSPGSLLVAQTIRRSIDEGLERFDFLRGDEPYKRRWKPQHAYRNLRVLLGEGTGQLGAAWNARAFGIEQKVRARFEGRSLKG